MSSERMSRQFRRLFGTLELLRRYRFGMDERLLNERVNDLLGETWHLRTTRRDLHFLREIGLADVTTEYEGRRWLSRERIH